MTDELATTADETAELPPRRSRSRGVALFLRDILFIFLAALLISFLIKTFLIRSFYIPSGSMEETLHLQDRVIVSLLTPGLTPLQRGDVVVFTDPGGWLDDETTPQSTGGQSAINSVLSFVGLAAPDDNNHLIKRVIGLPGDHVKCCSPLGQVEVNGIPLNEPYVDVPKGTPAEQYSFNVTVPKGDIWVMGDNRDESADSAYHEHEHDATPFVPISDVTGRAMVISWPASRWAYLSNYPNVFLDVDKKKK
jgi:signal peptidase I